MALNWELGVEEALHSWLLSHGVELHHAELREGWEVVAQMPDFCYSYRHLVGFLE